LLRGSVSDGYRSHNRLQGYRPHYEALRAGTCRALPRGVPARDLSSESLMGRFPAGAIDLVDDSAGGVKFASRAHLRPAAHVRASTSQPAPRAARACEGGGSQSAFTIPTPAV